MATYKFPEFEIQIVNPSITVVAVNDHCDGTCTVTILLAVGGPQNPTAQFSVTFEGFTYEGDEPIKADVDAWALIEIAKYEV